MWNLEHPFWIDPLEQITGVINATKMAIISTAKNSVTSQKEDKKDEKELETIQIFNIMLLVDEISVNIFW